MINSNGEIIELTNQCDIPEEGFILSPEDILEHFLGIGTVASWHTHPGDTNVLSVGDFEAFTNYPDIDHYVIGSNGVQKYQVSESGALLKCE